MNERMDPYFEQRLQIAKNHQVLESLKIEKSGSKTESNKELPHPTLQGSIEEFGWSEKSVENIIDALEKNFIKINFVDDENIRIEFCPIKQIPEQLGHISELDTIKNNLKGAQVFGSPQSDEYTYLQTIDFSVEGCIDDESEGRRYGRVYLDSAKLSDKRNIYLDPESLHITDYEYGYSFCVMGGVPLEAISGIDVIRAKKLPRAKSNESIDTNDWPDDPKKQMLQQAERLKKYLKSKLKTP